MKLPSVNLEMIDSDCLVVFRASFDWRRVTSASHSEHMEMIRDLSEGIDDVCLNAIRYHLCRIEPADIVPARVGQLTRNSMMSGVLLYTAAGVLLTHYRWCGLYPLRHPWGRVATERTAVKSMFPTEGEVGRVVTHTLALYRDLIQADSATMKLTQAMFLGDVFRRSWAIWRVPARYKEGDCPVCSNEPADLLGVYSAPGSTQRFYRPSYPSGNGLSYSDCAHGKEVGRVAACKQ